MNITSSIKTEYINPDIVPDINIIPLSFYSSVPNNEISTDVDTIKSQLHDSCKSYKVNTGGLFTNTETKTYLATPIGGDTAGTISTFNNQIYNAYTKNSTNSTNSPDNINVLTLAGRLGWNRLHTAVDTFVDEKDTTTITNQLLYLTCQLVKSRVREYNLSTFGMAGTSPSIKSMFENFSGAKLMSVVIFFVTLYLLISGTVSSLDVGLNIIDMITELAHTKAYWFGIFGGLAFTFIILVVILNNRLNVHTSSYDNLEITNNPFGDKKNNKYNSIDIVLIVLYILVLYVLIGLMYITASSENITYTIKIVLLLLLLVAIAVLLFIMYYTLPYISSHGTENDYIGSTSELHLYANKIDAPCAVINSNQGEQATINKIALTLIACSIIGTILLCIVNKSDKLKNKPGMRGVVLGVLGSLAILSIPLIWICNWYIGLRFFYIYPIILIIARFIRYIGHYIMYSMREKLEKSNNFSNYARSLEETNSDYTASWSLLGISVLKSIFNIIGYDNKLTNEILKDNDKNRNLASNKIVSSLLVALFAGGLETNKQKSKYYTVIIYLLTVVIGCAILFAYVKIQKI